jgi:hypothetical protein
VKKQVALGLLVSVLAFAGCGDSDSGAEDAANEAAAAAESAQQEVTDLQDQLDEQASELAQEKRAAKRRAQKAQKAAAVAPKPEPAETSDPPNVVGLTLPAATKLLKGAGFQVDARNTDTAFGIINPDNYSICEQDSPRGTLVPVLAQKYGC